MGLKIPLLMGICFGFMLCINALPTKTDEESKEAPIFSPSRMSKIISTNLLKSYIDIDGNQVHSPLGVASILAVLAEGSSGDTYAEFNTVFGYPQERKDLRASFKQLLSKYHNRAYSADPSFQTWLYIYRNYSALDAYKEVVRDNYLVEVKDINRIQYDWSEPNTSLDASAVETTTASNSKDVVGFETLKRIKLADVDIAAVETSALKDTYGEEVIDKVPSKFDRIIDDKVYVEKPVILEEIKREEQKEKELALEIEKEKEQTINEEPKEEKLKEEEQTAVLESEPSAAAVDAPKPVAEEQNEKSAELPAEAAVIIEEKSEIIQLPIAGEESSLPESKTAEEANIEENETVQAEEKLRKNSETIKDDDDNILVPIQEVLDSNEPEKVTLPLQKLENAIDEASKDAGEIMIALESHISSVRRIIGARSLFRKDDIATALSANSLTGRELGAKTKMLLFNGLYYRGSWAKPFLDRVDTEDEHFFYVTAEDAMKVPMMYSKSAFKTLELEKLNAKAVYLPYENEKYALLVIVPNELEGLRALIDKLDSDDFKYIRENAKEKDLCVCLPKFQVEETSRSESMLKNLGLRKIFSREEADLSLLSDDKDLHVDEVVQFVNVRVDEFGSTGNSLSASSLVRTVNGDEAAPVENSEKQFERLEINRPFLYFLTDLEEDFIIASGKIYAPEHKEESPITVEVEFEQA